MKNIEKYTNTKAALEAYNKLDFKKVPFDEWLESEYEEPTLLEAAEDAANEWFLKGFNHDKMSKLLDAVIREKKKPVRNFDKYRTDEEAFVAYSEMCDSRECKLFNFRYCGNSIKCALAWLYADADMAEAEKEESDE